eukprot:EG_transcript_59180
MAFEAPTRVFVVCQASTKENELWDVLGYAEGLISIELVRDKVTGVGKGYGYATFHTASQASAAIRQYNGKKLASGKVISLKKCTQPPPGQEPSSPLVAAPPGRPEQPWAA